MNLDPDLVLGKRVQTVAEWIYFSDESTAYDNWRVAEAEWRAARAIDERQVH